MEIKKKIKIGNSNFEVIDLTEPISENTEVYPGDPSPKKQIFCEIEKTGYEHYIQIIGDHNFHAHGDAPNHQNIDMKDKGFDSFDINFCFNDALFLDLGNVKEVRKEDIEKYADIIKTKGALIVRTGYDYHLEENKKHIPENIPYFNKEAADFISSFKNLKVIGTDSLTVDPSGSHYSHQKFKNMLIVESMVHLHDIYKNEFFLETTPVRIKGATGGPVVAYAFIEI